MNGSYQPYEFDLEKFTRHVVQTLKLTENNVRLDNPSSTAVFPCVVVSNPMDYVEITKDDKTALKSIYQITVECWADNIYDAMALDKRISNQLRTKNILPKGGTITRSDSNTSKKIVGHSYEVIYNGVLNTLERIK